MNYKAPIADFLVAVRSFMRRLRERTIGRGRRRRRRRVVYYMAVTLALLAPALVGAPPRAASASVTDR